MAPPGTKRPWYSSRSNSSGSGSGNHANGGGREHHDNHHEQDDHHNHRHHRHHHNQPSSGGGGGGSVQCASALEIVAAFNHNIDTQTIASYRGPGFMREVLPASLRQAPQDAHAFQRVLNMYRAVFRHYRLEVGEVVDDPVARKVCLWLTARADTAGGEYVCDMVWSLTFDEKGKKVVVWKEFLDAGAKTVEFLPETMDERPSSG